MARSVSRPEVRSVDGSGNNQQNPDWGKAGEPHPRLVEDAYEDGYSAPSGSDRPNPRDVSNKIMHQRGRLRDPDSRSGMVWAWGQFLDHDITFTPTSGAMDWNISIPAGDPYMDPEGKGKAIIPFSRSIAAPGTGENSPRQQLNEITSWIDGSMVYGSDPVRAAALRSFDGGKLRMQKTENGDLLPFNTERLPVDNPMRRPVESLHLAGDVRANENLGLLSLHTLFAREHNRLADELKMENPDWSDEQLYQEARRIVGAEIQAITYNEFLPSIVGEGTLPEYKGYDPNVDPRISNEFATAAYRMGHSQLEPVIWRSAADGNAIPERDLALHNAYFAPERLNEGGIEPLLRGLTEFIQEPTDEMVTVQVRNMLFGRPGQGGLDLAAINIQRGRDHGLPGYVALRRVFGGEEITSFDQVTNDPVKLAKLKDTYDHVDQIDPWVGLLCEDPVEGAAVGPTLQAVLTDQFVRLRDGDRFWYQNDPALESRRSELDSLGLADVIRRNTEIGDEIDDTPFTGFKFVRKRPTAESPA